MNFWVGESGKIAVRSTGKALISPTSPCCCIPHPCPCGTWPNTSDPDPEDFFPCGGLTYIYTVTSYLYRIINWDGGACGVGTSSPKPWTRLVGTCIVTAQAGTRRCTWMGEGTFEDSSDGGATWGTPYTDDLYLIATRTGYQVVQHSFPATAAPQKALAGGPIGAYERDLCIQEIFDLYDNYLTEAEVA